jgi:predicted RecB family nuclease
MRKPKDELMNFANVGPAIRADLHALGIDTAAALAKAEPDELYIRLCALTGTRQDPCVWDVFAAVVHEARTGEKTKWWAWTKERKKRQSAGTFKF